MPARSSKIITANQQFLHTYVLLNGGRLEDVSLRRKSWSIRAEISALAALGEAEPLRTQKQDETAPQIGADTSLLSLPLGPFRRRDWQRHKPEFWCPV